MKKLALKIALIVFIIVIYIFSINLFASLINSSSETQTISGVISGRLNTRISLSESVSITITRNRWYGKIIINNGIEYLYLFNLIRLPKKIQNYNFVIFHLIFLVTLILFTILLFIEKKVYKEEEPNQLNQLNQKI